LNNVPEDLKISIKNIRKNLALCIDVILTRCPKAAKGPKLGGLWIKVNPRNIPRVRKNFIKDTFKKVCNIYIENNKTP